MRFDIKYAYFNFLQLLPHPILCNPASSEKLGLESQHNSSIHNSEDESSMDDVTASANGNLVHHPYTAEK